MDNNQHQEQEQEEDLALLNTWPHHTLTQQEDAFAFAATEPYADPFQFGNYSLSEEYSNAPVPPDYSQNQQLLQDPQASHLPPNFAFSQENPNSPNHQPLFQFPPADGTTLAFPQTQNHHPPQTRLVLGSDSFVNPQQLDASFNRPHNLVNDPEASHSNTPSDAGTPPLDSSGQRRVNRSFTLDQRQRLEKCFAQYRYPSKQVKEELMANTGLGLLQINNWFTRKRLAEKEEGVKDDSPRPGSADSSTMSDTFGIPMYPNPAVMSSFAAGTNNTSFRPTVAGSTSGKWTFPALLPRLPSANASSSYARTAQGLPLNTLRPDDPTSKDHAKPVGGLSSVMSQLAAMVDVGGGLRDDTDIEAIKRLFQKETNLGAKSVLLRTLQKTTNQNVLKKIAESKVVVAVRNWLVNATKENSDLQVLLLEVIKHLPISIEMLKTTNMGKLVRKAGSSDKPDVQRTANEVERHLKSAVQDEAQRRKEEEERERERLEREQKEKQRLEKEREREKAERAKKELERRAKDREERERKLKERETQRLKEVEERRKQREAEAAKKAELVRKSMLEEEAESRKKAKIGGQDAGLTAVTNFDFFNQLAGSQTASRSVRPSAATKLPPVRKTSADSFPSAVLPSSESTSADHVNSDRMEEDKAEEEESPEKGFEIVLPPAPKNTTSFTDMYHMAEDVFHDLIPEVRSGATSNTATQNLLSSTLPDTPSTPSQDSTFKNEDSSMSDVSVSESTTVSTETAPQEPNRLPGRPFTIRKATEAEVANANAGALSGTITRRPSKGILKRMMEGDDDFEKFDGMDEGKGKKRQRRISFGVRFAPENELVKVRMIEARDVNMSVVNRNAKDLDRNEGRVAFKRSLEADQPWATPRLIQLPTKIDPNLRGKHSNEDRIQAQREESVLMAVYLNKEDIPASPLEADVDIEGEQGEVKIIPTEDVKNPTQFLPQNSGFVPNHGFNLSTSTTAPTPAPEISNNISDILKNLTSMGLVRPPPPPPVGQPVKETQPVTGASSSSSLPGTSTTAPGNAMPNLDSILSMLSNTGNANQQRQVPTPMQQQNRPPPFHPPTIPAAGLPAGPTNGGLPAFDPNLLTNIMATINGVLKPGSQNVPSGPPHHAGPTPPSMMGMPGFSPWEQGHLGGMQPPFNFRPPAEFSHPPREDYGRGRGEAFYEPSHDNFRGGRGMRGGGQRGMAGQRGRGVPKRGGRGGAVGMGDGGANNWDPAARAGAGKQQYSENRRRA